MASSRVVPRSRGRSAANISILACLIVILMFVLTAVGVMIAGDWIAFALGSSAIAPLLWLLPLSVLFGGLNSVALHWNTRRTAYTRQSASEISRSAGTTSIQILAGLANAGAKGLVLGRVAGSALATLVLCTKIYRQDGKLIWASFDPGFPG